MADEHAASAAPASDPSASPDPAGACPTVAVVICAYNSGAYLPDCLSSVTASIDPGLTRHIILVDDASPDDSCARIAPTYPEVHLLRLDVNRGFAGANNAGWEYVRTHFPDTKYLVLLNVDTEVESGWLAALASLLEAQPSIGAAQSRLMLHDRPTVLNTLGNENHYLGFGFLTAFGESDAGQYSDGQPIAYASGAAVAVRMDLLEQVGLFDPYYYMYLEDTELSWKLRQLGYTIALAARSVVRHKYLFKTPTRYYRYLERNRWLLLLTYYRLPTLLLLLPALLFMECGQLAFAAMTGVLGQKLRSYVDLLTPRNLARLWRARRAAQRRRTISDREFLAPFRGRIDFALIQSPLLRYLANPILGAYWAIARRLIFW